MASIAFKLIAASFSRGQVTTAFYRGDSVLVRQPGAARKWQRGQVISVKDRSAVNARSGVKERTYIVLCENATQPRAVTAQQLTRRSAFVWWWRWAEAGDGPCSRPKAAPALTASASGGQRQAALTPIGNRSRRTIIGNVSPGVGLDHVAVAVARRPPSPSTEHRVPDMLG